MNRTRTRGSGALITILALAVPFAAAAQSDPDFDFDLTPFVNSPGVDCSNRPAGDPAPPADIVVDPTTAVPDFATAFLAAGAGLADSNGDGVISICVEPGTYAGAATLSLGGLAAPVWLWSSKGLTVTTVDGGPGAGTGLTFEQGVGPLPPVGGQWAQHLLVRGLEVTGWQSTTPGGGLRLTGLDSKVGNLEFSNVASADIGGGIAVVGGYLRVYNSTFSSCAGSAGGAVAGRDTDLELWKVSVDGCSARDGGAGFSVESSSGQPLRSLSVEGSSFTNSVVPGAPTAPPANRFGGCGWVSSLESVTITDSVFDGCEVQLTGPPTEAAHGGALYARSVNTLDIASTVIARSVAHGDGGGIATRSVGTTSLSANSMLEGNDANGEGGGANFEQSGGAAGFAAVVSVRDTVIHGNTAAAGGGLHFTAHGTLASLRDSSIYGNQATAVGGSGGGISSAGADLTIVDTDVFGNDANDGLGGGLFVSGNPLLGQGPALIRVLANSWFSGNAATAGGSIYCDGETSSVELTVSDSELRNSEALGFAPGWGGGGGLAASGCDAVRIEQSAGVLYNCAPGAGAGIHLAATSFSIEDSAITGNGAGEPGRPCPTLPSNGGGLYIIAPVAGPAILGPGVSIEDNVAVSSGGGLFYQETTPANSTQLYVDDTTFEGNAARNGAGAYFFGAAASIQSGTRFVANDAGGVGGGLAAVSWGSNVADMKLDDVEFSGNTADQGAGVALTDSAALFSNTVLINNDAMLDGGGVYASCSSPSTSIEFGGGVLRDNDASPTPPGGSGDGGGMAITGCDAAISDTLFELNTAGGDGGALWVEGAPTVPWTPSGATAVSLDGVTISSNSAGGDGGGLFGVEIMLSHSGGGYQQNTAAGGTGGAMMLAEPAAVELSELAIHENSAASAGGAQLTASEVSLLNVLVVENSQVAGAALEIGPPSSTPETFLDFQYLTVAGNYGNAGNDVNGLLIRQPAGFEVNGTIDSSVIAMNEGVLQLDEPPAVETSNSLFYSHNPVEVELVLLLNNESFASGNGCLGDNPQFGGASLTGGSPIPSTNNWDPWGPYAYYSYLLLSGSPGSTAGIGGTAAGAFGGNLGGWCAGLALQTCVP